MTFTNEPNHKLSGKYIAWLGRLIDNSKLSRVSITRDLRVLLIITSSNEKLVIQASRLLGTGGSKRIDSVYSSTLENSPAIYQTVLGRSARFEYLLPRIYPYISDVEKKTQIETAMEVINPGLSWKDQLKLVTISSEEKYLDRANLGCEGKLLPSENL